MTTRRPMVPRGWMLIIWVDRVPPCHRHLLLTRHQHRYHHHLHHHQHRRSLRRLWIPVAVLLIVRLRPHTRGQGLPQLPQPAHLTSYHSHQHYHHHRFLRLHPCQHYHYPHQEHSSTIHLHSTPYQLMRLPPPPYHHHHQQQQLLLLHLRL